MVPERPVNSWWSQHTLVGFGQRRERVAEVAAGTASRSARLEARRKAHRAVALALQQVVTTRGQQALHHGQGQRLGIQPVALEEARQSPVGVEQEGAPLGVYSGLANRASSSSTASAGESSPQDSRATWPSSIG
jgi:hypothetical protein